MAKRIIACNTSSRSQLLRSLAVSRDDARIMLVGFVDVADLQNDIHIMVPRTEDIVILVMK